MTDSLPDWVTSLTSALDAKLGVELESVTPQRAVASAPVLGNTQPFGQWHGGASAVMAETLASVAGYAHARELGKVAVGTELSLSHLAPATSGRVHGEAVALRLGRNLVTYAIRLTDDDGRLVCAGQVSCFLRDDPRAASARP